MSGAEQALLPQPELVRCVNVCVRMESEVNSNAVFSKTALICVFFFFCGQNDECLQGEKGDSVFPICVFCDLTLLSVTAGFSEQLQHEPFCP